MRTIPSIPVHMMKRNNQFKPNEDEPLDKNPLTIKLRIGVRDKIKAIPEWQAKLRDLLEEWVNQNQKD